MKRFLTRASVAGLSAALVAGVALVAAPAASAAQVGTLNFGGLAPFPNANGQTVGFTMQTSGACAPTATNFLVRITNDTTVVGNTAPTVNANLMGNTSGGTVAGFNSGPFTVTSSQTIASFAAANGLGSALPSGSYRVDLVCRTSLSGTSLGDYTGILTIGAAGAVTNAAPLLTNISTSTIVTASPASIDTLGTSTFTATVSPAAGSTIAGNVQFKVDGVNFGSPVAVNAAGVATSGAYSSSVVGSKSITAVFAGGSDANNNYGTSTSAPATLAVTQATATTTTGIALSSASVAYPATVTATATVTRGAGVPVTGGTVQFQVDGTNFGSPVAVNASGVAVSAAIARNAGTYGVTAVFSGFTAAGVQYNGSTSSAASFTVTAAAFTPDVQNITTSIAAGTLVISTPYTETSPLVLDPMTLNSTATEYSTSAAFTGITVADTRPGNLPWTVSALASDLTKFGVAVPNNNEIINGQNVGLTALTLTSTNATPNTFSLDGVPAGANLQATSNPAGAHLAAGAAGTAGLGGSPKVVLHANTGLGTTVTAGTLTITAPTNTLDGTYNGIITFTIIGS